MGPQVFLTLEVILGGVIAFLGGGHLVMGQLDLVAHLCCLDLDHWVVALRGISGRDAQYQQQEQHLEAQGGGTHTQEDAIYMSVGG